MSQARASTATLVALACAALIFFTVAERSLMPVHAVAFEKKHRAVALMQQAERAIAAAKRNRGVAIDERNDPEGSGVIGPQFSLVTTDRGVQSAKVLAAHPNFAAAATQLMIQAGVGEGDLVAIGMTGSLPGLNLAVLSACRALGAEPVIVTSVGSSMFGATDASLTWLDMEGVLVKAGLWPYRSMAASLGGGGDVGRGLSPAGRQILVNAIQRSGARFLDASNVYEAVRTRVALYDSIATARGTPIRLYVNVGGGVASLGGAQNARLIPAGLTTRLAAKNYPNRGVLNVLAERRVPVLNLLEVEKLARQFGITNGDGSTTVKPGKGLLFIKYRYNLWVVGTCTAALFLLNVFVLRLDLRQRILGRPHPERQPTP